MITINSGKLVIPEDERFIGFAGDNLHSKKQFLVEKTTDENCIYRLYLQFDDSTVNYFVLDSKVENSSTILTWNILEEHIFKSGIVNAQIKSIAENGETYHTSWDYFFVAPSAEFSGEFKDNENAEFLRYEKELNEIYKKIHDTDLSSFVPSTRSIAGLTLEENIFAQELCEALDVYPTLLKEGAPAVYDGQVGSFLVDTLNSDFYYCNKRTLSGNNWLKLSGSTESSNGIKKAQINEKGELILTYVNGTTSNLGVVVGNDGAQGIDGKNGKSAYQIALDNGFVGTEKEWLTSLKGENGETPIVSNVATDNGYKIYFETEQKTEVITINNGEKGSDGKTAYEYAKEGGFSGTEAEFTENLSSIDNIPALVNEAVENEKGNIVDLLITQLQGLPVFGIVDSNNTIKITSQLSDGIYALRYENDDGTYSNIGTITIGNAETVSYTNLVDTTLTTDTTITTSSEGWLEHVRINSSKAITEQTDNHITNIIPVGSADILRIKGMDINGGYGRIYVYTGTTFVHAFVPTSSVDSFVSLGDTYAEISIHAMKALYAKDDITFDSIRIGGTLNDTKENVIITLDEDIT